MAITIDDIQASYHSIKISDGTDELAIAADGSIAVTDNGGSLTIDNAELVTLAGAVSGTEMQVDVITMPSVTVTATDLDIRDLIHTQDSIKIGDGTDFLAIAADGSIAVTDNGGSLTVDGTVAATQSGAWSVDLASGAEVIITDGTDTLEIDASGFITANINGTVTVSATDLDIRDLTHVSDSVKIGDGTDFLAINADGSVNAQTVPSGFDSWQTSVVSASTTVGELAATPLSNRLRMIIQNLGSQDCFVGEDNTVTVGNGIKLPKGSSLEVSLGAVSNIWAITASGTADLRIAEYAA